jgi:hypothetical protein
VAERAGVPGGFGRFMFTMVDFLQVPDVPAGEYSVSWRWDWYVHLRSPISFFSCLTPRNNAQCSMWLCSEETPQVWSSCADVMIT